MANAQARNILRERIGNYLADLKEWDKKNVEAEYTDVAEANDFITDAETLLKDVLETL